MTDRKPKADIETTYMESFVMVRPVTVAGEAWVLDNVDDAIGYFGGFNSFPCEHRCFPDLAYGAMDAGLRVLDTATSRIAVPA